MELKEYKVDYPKEALELGMLLNKILSVSGAALKDGFQPAADVSVILSGVLGELMPALEGIQKIAEEGKECPVKTAAAVVAPVMDGVAELMKSLKK